MINDGHLSGDKLADKAVGWCKGGTVVKPCLKYELWRLGTHY